MTTSQQKILTSDGPEPSRSHHKKHPKPADFEGDPAYPDGHRLFGRRRCTAWARNANDQCSNQAIPGRTKCNMHGGASPSGAASSQFKHGKYSKDIPTNLMANYEASMQNHDLISLREEIALIEAHTMSLLGKVDREGDSAASWSKLKDLVQRYHNTKKADAKETYLEMILATIDKGATEAQIWDDVYKAIAERRKLVDTEFRRLVQFGHMLNIEQLMTIIGRLLGIIKGHVDDGSFALISRELRGLVHKPDSVESARDAARQLPLPDQRRIRNS